jgi:hypothetical protein
MSKAPIYRTHELEIVLDLPAALSREIGRAIVLFAALENLLSRSIYALLDISRQEGRLAVREPRTTDRFDLLRDLIEVKGLKPTADLKMIRAVIEKALEGRNRLAHGIWTLYRGHYVLRLTTGQYQPRPPARTKRIVHPQGIRYDAARCREVVADTRRAFDLVEKLATELALFPSRGKPK